MSGRRPWQGQGGPARKTWRTGAGAARPAKVGFFPTHSFVGYPGMRQGVARGRGVFSGSRNPSKIFAKNSGELKGMDTRLTVAGPVISTVTTNADAILLNAVEPGNGSYNRIGRKIFAKTARLSGLVQFTYSGNTTTLDIIGNCMRMVVVWDKQPSGVLPKYDEIFGSTSQDGTETSDVLDNLRYDNTARFQVLRDLKICATPFTTNNLGGTTDLLQNKYHFDEFIDLKNRTTVFSGDSDPVTIADISSGGLYVYFRAQVSIDNITDFAILPESICRLRFTS